MPGLRPGLRADAWQPDAVRQGLRARPWARVDVCGVRGGEEEPGTRGDLQAVRTGPEALPAVRDTVLAVGGRRQARAEVLQPGVRARQVHTDASEAKEDARHHCVRLVRPQVCSKARPPDVLLKRLPMEVVFKATQVSEPRAVG